MDYLAQGHILLQGLAFFLLQWVEDGDGQILVASTHYNHKDSFEESFQVASIGVVDAK